MKIDIATLGVSGGIEVCPVGYTKDGRMIIAGVDDVNFRAILSHDDTKRARDNNQVPLSKRMEFK